MSLLPETLEPRRELRATFRSRGVPSEESADLAQDAILRTLLHLKRRGRTEDDIRPLVHTIGRNLLIDPFGPAALAEAHRAL